MDHEHFPAARFIKEIGRGVKGARSLPRDEARELYAAMLDGRVGDLELGAIVMALRIKGESVDELAGFMDAARASFAPLPPPGGRFMPVVIPSYNGARKLPNLVPLLAMLLASEGVPVLVHGVRGEAGRVTTAEIGAQLGWSLAAGPADVQTAWAGGEPAFMPIDVLAPKLARQLALREVLGVRNSAHTLVKMLQPFDGPALRLVSYTHPEYLLTLGDYFARPEEAGQGGTFLMRGTEGEAVANPHRGQQIDWFHDGTRTVLAERDPPTDVQAILPDSREAGETAQWIRQALDGGVPVPATLSAQVAHCVTAARLP